MIINTKVMLILCGGMLYAQQAFGHTGDQSMAHQCKSHLLQSERQNQIPKGLLFAIAQAESGRKVINGRGSHPWPWTANVQGRPMYFSTKAEAVTEITRLIKLGIRNIDIGCMQINYHHHGHHFPSLVHMFEPKYNVEYGARFLKALRRVHGSWTKAVGLYHSATPELQLPYKRRVYVKWQQEWIRLYQEELMAAQASLQTNRF